MRTAAANAGSILAALLCAACSLIVDDLSPGRCTAFEDCAPLNDRDRLDALSCELWTCDAATLVCVRRPRDRDGDAAFGPHPARAQCDYEVTDCDDADPTRAPGLEEVCDGVDNDCDLAIDESTTAERQFAIEGAAAGPFQPGDVGRSTRVAFPSTQDPGRRELLVAIPSAGAVRGRVVVAGSAEARDVTWRSYCGGVAEPTAGCIADSACSLVVGCDFAEPAVDVANDRTWGAFANTVGCASGESSVRVGLVADAEVRIDASGAAALGAPTCASGPARAPAMAVLPDARTALVAHVADVPSAEPACGSVSASVRVVALDLDDPRGLGRASFGASPTPLVLGPAISSAAPAIAALGTDGWVVGFGAQGGGADLFWIAADAASAIRIGTVGTEPTREVRLAPVAGTSPTMLGVLRQASCDAGAMVYQTARFDLGDPSGSFAASAPVELSAGGRAPALVRVDRGLVVEGFAREAGGPAASASQTGGWVAMWSETASGATFARRILALDDQPLTADAERVTDAAGGASWIARASGDRLVDAFVFDDDDTLRSIALYCARP